MSLLLKGGISKLSELEIDTDKDWQGKGITNIKQVAAGMAIGHILQHSGSILEALVPGPAHNVLTSEGPGKKVVWAPGGTYFERFLPVSIDLDHTQGLWSPDKTEEASLSATTSMYRAYEDAPMDFIKRLTPAISLGRTAALFVPDNSHEKAVAAATAFSLKTIVEGAVADDGGAQTDETAAAQDVTADDMTLLPAIPALDDAYYFGHSKKFDTAWLDIGTRGNGVWDITWEYWNGTAWALLADVVDNTDNFRAAAGLHYMTFTRPADWTTTTVGGAGSLYWIRGRVSSYTSIVTQPRGSRAWVEMTI